MELYNESRPSETAKFQDRWFQHIPEIPSGTTIVAASTYNDPAISEKETADEAVTITVLQSDKGKIYVVEGWGSHDLPSYTTDDILTEFFRQHKKHAGMNHASFAGIESNAYQASLVHTCRQWMFKKGYYFNLEGVTHTKRKSARILGILQPRFQNGYIIFVGRWPRLETQLLDYVPDRDQPDDWPDALAGAIEGLDPAAAFYGEDVEPNDEEDDPYGEGNIPDLRKEVGNWEYN
jgi:predicted phage terminase large subunit-like protein